MKSTVAPFLIVLSFAFPIRVLASSPADDSLPLGPVRPGVVHVRPNPANCSEYIAKAQATVNLVPQIPVAHKWIVVCSLDSWNTALRKAGVWGRTNTAFTTGDTTLTLINGAVFEESPAFYRRVIFHEAGHVLCHCSNERRAEDEGKRIEAELSNRDSVRKLHELESRNDSANPTLGNDQ